MDKLIHQYGVQLSSLDVMWTQLRTLLKPLQHQTNICHWGVQGGPSIRSPLYKETRPSRLPMIRFFFILAEIFSLVFRETSPSRNIDRVPFNLSVPYKRDGQGATGGPLVWPPWCREALASTSDRWKVARMVGNKSSLHNGS